MKFLKICRTAAFAFIFACIAVAAAGSAGYAEIPTTINYQGYLTDEFDEPLTDDAVITLALYETEDDEFPVWIETHDVFVENGLFSVLMGSITPLDLTFDAPYYLGVTVDDDEEMIPRYALSSAAYAMGGLTGPQGEQGEKGDTGETGPQGEQGEKGEKGDTGARGAKGIQGEQGDQGEKGDTGETGPQGEQGEKGDTGDIGMTWQGAWQEDVDYLADDAVSYDGSAYICLLDHTSSDANNPTNTDTWDLFAAKGDTGEQGEQGIQGEKGDKGDTGATGAKGDTGATGAKGDTGATGAKGDTGATGAKGDTGEDGEDGQDADFSNLKIGTYEWGPISIGYLVAKKISRSLTNIPADQELVMIINAVASFDSDLEKMRYYYAPGHIISKNEVEFAFNTGTYSDHNVLSDNWYFTVTYLYTDK